MGFRSCYSSRSLRLVGWRVGGCRGGGRGWVRRCGRWCGSGGWVAGGGLNALLGSHTIATVL